MPNSKPDAPDLLSQQQTALSRWDTEGGAGPRGPQEVSISDEVASERPRSATAGHLVAALTESLKTIEGDYREEMHELHKLFQEAKREAEEDEPNALKLKAILTDCNEIVRTFAALDPAWQGVQRVARMLGVL